MKKTLIYLGITLFFLSSFKVETVDIYSVIRVFGNITHLNNGKELFTGDKVREDEKLKFKTPASKAAVISSKRGRFVLTSSNSVKLGLMPAMNNISSRAGALINLIDLQNHFKGKYLVLDGYEVEINEKSFPMNTTNFFFLRFSYNDETISKKLTFNENKLILDKSEILKIDGKDIDLKDVEMDLYYRDSEKKTSNKISSFTPIFPDEEILKVEMKIILEEYSDKDSKKKIEEITAYLNENYGKPHSDNLKGWLKSNFKLSE